jgi:hypothetical protein
MIIATKGLKSTIPVWGSIRRMGFNTGSTTRLIVTRIGWNGSMKYDKTTYAIKSRLRPREM